jgi:6-pyruvoyltetrahydropterin/6-carboxytetrahydropterin synthase
MEISQTFTFEAAHTLARLVPLVEYEPSMRIHGHSYVATVSVKGEMGADGMLQFFRLPKNKRQRVDLFYLRKEIQDVRAKLDHRFLNEIEDLPHQTLEALCVFIFNHINQYFPVAWVKVERPLSGDACRYDGVK